jgi:hypothetical protein
MAMKELIDEGVSSVCNQNPPKLPTRQRNPQSWWLMDDSGSNVDTHRLAMFHSVDPTDAVHPNGWKVSAWKVLSPQNVIVIPTQARDVSVDIPRQKVDGKGVKAARIRLVMFSIPSDTDLKKLVQHIDKDGIQQLPRQSEFSDNV